MHAPPPERIKPYVRPAAAKVELTPERLARSRRARRVVHLRAQARRADLDAQLAGRLLDGRVLVVDLGATTVPGVRDSLARLAAAGHVELRMTADGLAAELRDVQPGAELHPATTKTDNRTERTA